MHYSSEEKEHCVTVPSQAHHSTRHRTHYRNCQNIIIVIYEKQRQTVNKWQRFALLEQGKKSKNKCRQFVVKHCQIIVSTNEAASCEHV